MRSSSDLLRSLLEEKLGAVKSQFEVLFDTLVSNDQQKIAAENRILFDLVSDLKRVVAGKDWPDCLNKLYDACDLYEQRAGMGYEIWKAHHRQPALTRESVLSFRFLVDEQEPIISFEEIIAKAESEYKVSELFNKIIDTLKDILDSGQIDSRRAYDDLSRVTEMMRRSRTASLEVKIMSWSFVKAFVPNLVSSYIKDSSIVGPALEAFEQTADELGVNLAGAKQRIGQCVVDAAKKSVQSISLASISFDSINQLPAPSQENKN